MALVEMSYLFCLLTHQLYEGSLQVGELFDLQMRVLRLKKGDQNFILEPGPLDRFGMHGPRQAPSESKTCRTEVRYGVDSPERAAVLLLSELYNWLSFEENRIPYTTVSKGARVIDPEQIVTAR